MTMKVPLLNSPTREASERGMKLGTHTTQQCGQESKSSQKIHSLWAGIYRLARDTSYGGRPGRNRGDAEAEKEDEVEEDEEDDNKEKIEYEKEEEGKGGSKTNSRRSPGGKTASQSKLRRGDT